MLSFIALALSVTSAHAAPELKIENIKQIVCENVSYYEAETPNQKTPARGVKIFVPGSRRDVRPAPRAFLLSEFDNAEGGGLSVDDNQQYYFDPIHEGGKITFAFIADWKANGELQLGQLPAATGWINQKGHVTELSCAVQLK